MSALTWSGCTNVRDLGGLPVEGGGAIRDRALVRSDSLTRLDEDATLADFYRGSLDRNTERIASVVRAFVDAPPGPVVVHCAAGKDRTGIIVALLLLVAGVPRESVVDDYVLSESEPEIERLLARLDADVRERAEAFSRSRPETIGTALEHLDATYGGVRAYLRDTCGLSQNEVTAVRTRLVGA